MWCWTAPPLVAGPGYARLRASRRSRRADRDWHRSHRLASRAANVATGDPIRQGSAGRRVRDLARCAQAGRPVAGRESTGPSWQREPARRGGVLAGLGQAGSLPCSPVSLGRDRVKERQPDEMIRRRPSGLTAPPGPPGAASVPGSAYRWPALSSVRLGLVHAEGYLPHDVRCTQRARTPVPTVMTASQIAPAVRSSGAAASGTIREITSTVGCLLILPSPRLC
jgi:hypothetical protein